MIRVSVIIPVYDALEQLHACLARLEQQTFPREAYEVIVVDNGSSADVRGACAAHADVRYEYEATVGSYAARVKGASSARGELLGFTDSDCLPAADWIERGVARLAAHPACGVIGGRIDLFVRDSGQPTAVELYECLFGFPQRTYVERDGWAATANMWTRAAMFDRVGPFNVKLKSGGDAEWGKRVKACGFEPVYADDVRVSHPARHSLGELRSKTRRVAGGFVDADRPLDKARLVVGHLMPPIKRFVRIAGDGTLTSKQKLEVAAVVLLHRVWTLWDLASYELGARSTR